MKFKQNRIITHSAISSVLVLLRLLDFLGSSSDAESKTAGTWNNARGGCFIIFWVVFIHMFKAN